MIACGKSACLASRHFIRYACKVFVSAKQSEMGWVPFQENFILLAEQADITLNYDQIKEPFRDEIAERLFL